MTTLTDCRFCLEKKRHVLEINNEIQNTFYLITQMKLNKLKNFSNSICFVCYKKLLAAHSYREMLVKIEEKLLCTFSVNTLSPLIHQLLSSTSTPQQHQVQQKQAKVIRSSEQNRTNFNNGFKKIKLSKQQSTDEEENENDQDDDDENGDNTNLLEEIVSFNAPDTSMLINEQDHEHDKQFALMSDVEINESQVKEEPSERSVVEIDESSNSQSQPTMLKPYKCNYPGCFSSSTTLIALKKHRRRNHGIRIQRPKIEQSLQEANVLYNQLVQASQGFKCKYCDLKLRNQRVLSRHIETVHKLAKFFCTIEGCNHASTRKDNYRLHLKNYHRNLPEEELKKHLDRTRDMKPVYVNQDWEGTDGENDEQSLNLNLGNDSWIQLPNFDNEIGC
ncbi:hypothetical protein PVAND_014457 [Polypedilum vanderplanki]|uniref:ZAD domain-containing protein n=1 Tax=Polypedilum vanderplanki TaxID=319348 RepID=A0A9J6B9R0_POLVA|nr:hypothetical protein PVAND_014457 [Polypedilum vanderplanki]